MTAARSRGIRVDLGPLDTESALSLVGQLAGGPPGPRLTGRVARASGNPLFVVELLTTLAQQERIRITPAGRAEVESGGAPAGAGRQRPAPPQPAPGRVDRTLRAAAICGRTVGMDELSMLTNRDTLALAEALRASARAGIVEPAATRCRSGTSSSTMRSTRTGRCRCAGRFTGTWGCGWQPAAPPPGGSPTICPCVEPGDPAAVHLAARLHGRPAHRAVPAAA